MMLLSGRPAREMDPILERLAADSSPLGEGWRLLGRPPEPPGPLLFATPAGELTLCLFAAILEGRLLSSGFELLAKACHALPLFQACPPPGLPPPRSARLLLIGGAAAPELFTAIGPHWSCLLVCEVPGQPGPPLILCDPLAASPLGARHARCNGSSPATARPGADLADEEVSRLLAWEEEEQPKPHRSMERK